MVRDARDSDINQIVSMLKDFSQEMPLECSTKALSPKKIVHWINLSISLGLCKIVCGEGGEGLRGVVLGVTNINVWSDRLKDIQMLVIYIKPEYRVTRAGYELFKSYLEETDKLMKKDPEIIANIVYEQPTGTNINYNKIGFKPFQTQHIKEK